MVAKGETRIEDNEGSIDPELGQEETTVFRAVQARLNYLSRDRPDETFATMKLCSKMSRPDAQDLKNMKRVGRFLVGRPRVGCLSEWQANPSALHTLADADWAGDRQSRRSVSGRHDAAREALDQGLDEAGMSLSPPAPPKQNCTLATARQQSRWEFRRSPKTWVEPSRFDCTLTPVRHCP